jgi:hypothetical protein
MKKILTSLLVLTGVSVFAQTSTVKSGTATTTTTAQSTELSEKAKSLFKTWYLSQT